MRTRRTYARRSRRIRRRSPAKNRRRYGRRSGTLARATGTAPPCRFIGTLFPPRLRCKMRYVCPDQYLTSVAIFDEHIFRGNNVYDPDVSLAGHQPMGYDQIAAAYERYYVRSSKIWVKVVNVSATGAANQIIRFYILANTDIGTATTANSFNQLQEEDEIVAGPRQVSILTVPAKPLSAWRSTRRMIAAPGRNSYDATGLTTSGVVPDEWYWHVCFYSNTLVNLPGNAIQYSCVLTYDVEFSERNVLAQS